MEMEPAAYILMFVDSVIFNMQPSVVGNKGRGANEYRILGCYRRRSL
jgi:hypothetical protein